MRRRGILLLASAMAPAALLAACGRAGPPRRPGPDEAITFPRRIYPKPDPPLVPAPAPPTAPTFPPAPAPAPAPPPVLGAPR